MKTLFNCQRFAVAKTWGENTGFQSRVGAVALYTVLWTVVAKYRKWPFSAPHRTKTPQPINTKI
jgi:hypothetical protein